MSSTPARGVTIRLFLVDGTPQGLRLVERMGWTGVILAFSRADYASARQRDEVCRTGVYVLVGPDPDGPRAQRIYVGEGDEVRSRLDKHQREKDFWTHGYVLTTRDDSLNKAHIRYLEARLLTLAATADNASCDNGTAPPVLRLSEPEVAEMETYLDNILPMFGVVGVNVFEPAEESLTTEETTPAANDDAPQAASGLRLLRQRKLERRLYLRGPLTEAEGEDRPGGFLVYAGARGRREMSPSISPGYRQLRERLIREGVMVEEGEQVRLLRSHLFDAPSAAANVFTGTRINGRRAWRDADGTTLSELQARTAS